MRFAAGPRRLKAADEGKWEGQTVGPLMYNLLRGVGLAGALALLPFAASLSVSAEDEPHSLVPSLPADGGRVLAALGSFPFLRSLPARSS
jgi:hypothetical protein